MTEDLTQRLRRAADDSDQPLRKQPGELLALGRRDRRRHRTWAAGWTGAALAVGTAAAVVALDATVPVSDEGQQGPAGAPTSRPTPSGDETLPLDLGPIPAAEVPGAAEQCAQEYGGAARFDVVYARRVDGLWGVENAIVLEDPDNGDVLACTATGGGYIDGRFNQTPAPDATHPVQATDGGGGATCWRKPATGARYGVYDGTWLLASDPVDRIEVRIGTAEQPGVWRESERRDGYLYAAYWFRQPFPADATIRVEARAYDVDGNPINLGSELRNILDFEMPSRSEPHGDPTLCSFDPWLE